MSLVHYQTGDYVVTGGRVERDTRRGLVNAIWFRLRTPLGSYWANTSLGSRLFALAQQRDVKQAGQLAIEYATAALKDLVDNRRISNLSITTARPTRGCLLLRIQCEDAAGEPVKLDHFIAVGV